MNENPPIVIAGKDIRDYLLAIGSRGLVEDEISLHFSDKHAGTVEYILRILRKSFGWEEKDRGKTETMNLKCVYDQIEMKECKTCKARKIIKTCSHPDLKIPGGCQEAQRAGCKQYKRKYNNMFTVNYVIIEKLPQIRM